MLERLQTILADRYRIERELGAGGMATVYLAEDLRHHRKVALKVLHPEIAATVGAGRFGREIEVAARLQHPNILLLLDSGEGEGYFFYVVLMLNGRYDFYFPVESSQNPMFDLLGTPPSLKRHVIAEGSHYVPRPLLIKETLDWLDRHLGPVR